MNVRKSDELGVIYMARHGETAWSRTGRHTGGADLPLTEQGERNARRLGERLKGLTFAKVLTSPLRRAMRTCELTGFGSVAEIDPDLVEWDYGDQALAARWIGVEPAAVAESLMLSTSSLSALGYIDSLSQPAIRLWRS
jgi:broad specificity phosphatase PhoE